MQKRFSFTSSALSFAVCALFLLSGCGGGSGVNRNRAAGPSNLSQEVGEGPYANEYNQKKLAVNETNSALQNSVGVSDSIFPYSMNNSVNSEDTAAKYSIQTGSSKSGLSSILAPALIGGIGLMMVNSGPNDIFKGLKSLVNPGKKEDESTSEQPVTEQTATAANATTESANQDQTSTASSATSSHATETAVQNNLPPSPTDAQARGGQTNDPQSSAAALAQFCNPVGNNAGDVQNLMEKLNSARTTGTNQPLGSDKT